MAYADIMPIDPAILGFSNVWYAGAADHPSIVSTPAGDLRHLDGPHFCATKLEAFASRAEGNLYHHDLEDFIALVDERESLIDEIAIAPDEVRKFLVDAVAGLLDSPRFLEALPGHLHGDQGSQRRLPMLLSRLHRIASLRAPTTKHAPRSAIFPPPPPASVPPRRTHRAAIGGGAPKSGPVVTHAPTLLRSSMLRSAEYEPTINSLTLEFHSGGLYRYAGVPPETYDGLLLAYSAGQYFHQWIRDRYPSTRLR
jgi:hypothetical protein